MKRILVNMIAIGLLFPMLAFAKMQHEERDAAPVSTESSVNGALFQVATMDALINGAYDSDYSYQELFTKGDFGLGTFNHLNGEMLAVDGHFYQMLGDGHVRAVKPSQKTPFAEVTFFKPQEQYNLQGIKNFAELTAYLEKTFKNTNIPYAVRIDGSFNFIKFRSVYSQHRPYPKITEVVKNQHIFELSHVDGTLVGFWIPSYMSKIGEAGLHLHFINQSKTAGGHVLEIDTGNINIQLQPQPQIMLSLLSKS